MPDAAATQQGPTSAGDAFERLGTWGPRRVRVVLVRPPQSPHAEGLREFAELLTFGFQRAGYPTTQVDNRRQLGALNVVIGWHLLSEDAMVDPARRNVLYNLEQLGSQPATVDRLVRLSSLHEIWDYSQQNVELLRRAGAAGEVRWVPVGYTPELTRIDAAPEPDIDVLFYGSMNDRRRAVLHGLREAGFRVESLYNVYGAARDAYLARAKVIVNIHFYPSSVFEVVRISYVLANRKAVVAECEAHTEIEPEWRDGVALAPYAALVSRCVALVHDDAERRALEERGFHAASRRDEATFLVRAIAASATPPTDAPI